MAHNEPGPHGINVNKKIEPIVYEVNDILQRHDAYSLSFILRAVYDSFIELGIAGGNTLDSKHRGQWEHNRDILKSFGIIE